MAENTFGTHAYINASVQQNPPLAVEVLPPANEESHETPPGRPHMKGPSIPSRYYKYIGLYKIVLVLVMLAILLIYSSTQEGVSGIDKIGKLNKILNS
ncbi:unnamed protein product [Clavelina lepadiformis]|uniref:Uncharacterized protein n=1 Tax=Clavelina lepadiformis TaxID=159417 RepID=A0ABP0FKV8_CLALP